MDLMKTLLVYMSLVFSSSVVTAPLPSNIPPAAISPTPTAVAATPTPSPTPTVKPTPTPRPTPDITPSAEYKTLSVGSRGEAVKKLQRRLAELGYLTGTVDGAFGNQTKRAVERFQYYNGLSVDGVAGQRTQTILYESTEVVFAPVDVTPTPSPKPTLKPTNTPAPTATATIAPTPTVFITPSPTPTPEPTAAPTIASTEAPTAAPTEAPTVAPTEAPTVAPIPTEAPITAPTEVPVETPAITPSPEVTETPVQTPTETPPIVLGELLPVENSSIYANGTLLVDEFDQTVPFSRRAPEEVLVPFTTLARLMSWVTVVDNGNMDEYSVEAGGYLLEVAYIRDEAGIVQSVEFKTDSLPVELLAEQATVVGSELYVRPEVLTALLNAQWSLAPDAPVLTLTFPPKQTQNAASQG